MKFRVRFLILIVLILSWNCVGVAKEIASQEKTILILHSYHQEYPWTSKQNQGFIQTLNKSYLSGDMKFSTEYLDTKRVNFNPEYENFFYLYLKQKYSDYSPDIIFSTDDNALNFLMKFKKKLFENSPVVFSGVNNLNVENKLDRKEYTGVFERKELIPNLTLIKKILPKPGKILFIGDNSSTFKAIKKQISKDFEKHMPNQAFEFIASNNFTTIINTLKRKKTGIIFLTTIGGIKDENDKVVPLNKALRSIVSSGEFTIISMEDVYLQEGILGGYVTSGSSQGKEAANLVLKIFKGVAPAKISLVKESPNQYVFNYPQIKKFGLAISQLPPESIVYNKPQSFYEIYKYRIWLALILLGMQMLIIMVLIQNIRNRKKAESKLKQTQQGLSQTVKERTVELTKTNTSLKNEIQERKQTEESLESQNQLMKTLLDNLQVGVFMIEAPTGKPLLANEAAKKMLGRGITENTDKSNIAEVYQAFKIKTGELYPQRELPIVKGLMGESTSIDDMIVIQPDGNKVYLEVFGSPVKNKNGDIVSSLVSFLDITERKKAEIELKKSEVKYRTLFENMTQGVFYQRADGKIFDFNKNALDMFGLTNDQFLGKTSFDPAWRIIHENGSDYPGDQHPSMVALKTGKPVLDAIAGVFNPIKNDFVWLNINAIPQFKNGESNPYQVFVTLHDVSDLRKAEAEARQAHKMESIGTLAGGIAHDFNNILSIIVGNTELALDDLQDWTPSYNNLKEIKIASLRAKDVVRQLLSFSRKTAQEQKPLDIKKVLKESINLIRSSIPSSIEIHEEIPEKIDTIFADATQIHQVLINLCTNSAHAMLDDGGLLEIILRSKVLNEKTDEIPKDLPPGNYVELIVKDSGSGIDPKIYDKIFDPYFTTKEVGKGTGMGLAVVHGIVKNHKGEIYVDSEPGKGTTFTILFPTIAEQPQQNTEITEVKLNLPGKETILFVDDEEALVDMAKMILEKLGYTVQISTNPVKALAIFEAEPTLYDLVISDMTMPKMSGVKLSEKLREIKNDIPIIICTGHSSLIDEEKAKDIGISAFAMKPITMSEIAKLIRSVLDK